MEQKYISKVQQGKKKLRICTRVHVIQGTMNGYVLG